jgi:cytochrome b
VARHVVLWDPLVRGFHWTLAIGFLLNRFVTEVGDTVHQWVGYVVVGLIAVRVAWGFRAKGAARWSSFWPTPTRLLDHLRDLRAGRPHDVLGHTPLGALVMIAMLVGVVALGLTGYAMLEIDYFWGDERLEALHAAIAQAVTVLAAIHVAAAVIESIRLRENLPLSMITGRRRVGAGGTDDPPS